MTVTLASAAQLLKRHGLLREIIRADRWTLDAHDIEGADTAFSAITYDTRDVREGTLLCCKGRFKAEYLHDIDERGLAAYVADTDFSAETGAPGLIVNDARKAMSLLSAEFYGRPQDELTVVSITGTKAADGGTDVAKETRRGRVRPGQGRRGRWPVLIDTRPDHTGPGAEHHSDSPLFTKGALVHSRHVWHEPCRFVGESRDRHR